MKKILIIILFINFCSLSNAQTLFQRTYGTSISEEARAVKQTSDGGYIIAAVCYFDSTYYIKTDSLGNKLWSKKINYPYVNDILETSNGEFLIIAPTDYTNCDGPYIIKLSSTGNIIWQKNYCLSYTHHFSCIKKDIDGNGFLLTGEGDSNFSMLVKIDNSGNVIWNQQMFPFGTNGHYPVGRWLAQSTIDSSIYVLGRYRYGGSSEAITLSKYLKNGTGIWSKTIAANGMSNGFDQSGFNIEETYNGNMMLSFGSGTYYLVEVDTSGTVVDSALKYIVSDYYSFHWTFAEPSLNKSIFFTYSTYNNRDIVLSKTDTSGNILWSKIIGGVSNETANSIALTTDKGLVMAGSTNSFSAGREDVYLIKTDSVGNFSCNAYLSAPPAMQTVAASSAVLSSVFSSITAWSVNTSLTISNVNDVSYDACGCVPPTAIINTDYPFPTSGVVNYSTWATSWLWDFGDGTTDTTALDYHQYAVDDTFYVCLTVTNACGASTQCDSINYVSPFPISVSEISTHSLSSVFPNPFHASATLKMNSIAQNYELKIYNTFGEQVEQQKIISKSTIIKREHLTDGIYFYQITNDKEILTSGKLVLE